ncbi:MAG: pyridoxal-phosphate dependent enzyme [Acidimicrobiia bacterium]|nr:pyridoxal-phosphate dependent enzyme [Acidimicrobiia bacterium]
MDIRPDILAAIGDTPMVRLSRIHPPGNVVAKLESFNPGGSSKDRIGIAMIEDAEKAGLLHPGDTIVEPTSGNTGVGLAMAAVLKGYRMVAVMADKQSKEKQDLLRAYGAEVVVTPSDVAPDDPRSYYSVAAEMASRPGYFRPDQYSNPSNPAAQYASAGPEIWRQTDGRVGVFVAGVGTGGTITGIGRYLKEQNPEVVVVGADPVGSIFTAASDDQVHPYLVEGVGEDFWPKAFDTTIVDEWERISDAEAFAMTRRLVREEGILAGGSGGMALTAALRAAVRHADRLVVVHLPDGGRNYLSKIFDDGWMRTRGFEEGL